MSYNFNQFRRTQQNSYLTPLDFSISTVTEESPLSKNVKFMERVINLSGSNVLQSVDETGTKQRCYYLNVRVQKIWESSQKITIMLVNTSKTTDNTQILETIDVEAGYESDYSTFEIVIPPNGTYNQIKFKLERTLEDYNLVRDAEHNIYGRLVNIEVNYLSEIINVIDKYLNSSIGNTGRLKQIGVQSAPGLQMCIDGEQVRIGRSGIYEINHGITIRFLGFIVQPNDNKYFILDYQY